MEDKKEDKHKITITVADNALITEKQKKALKKKKKKKLKSITNRHPEFELTYDMMLGIRYAVSLSEPSITTTTRTRTRTTTNTTSISVFGEKQDNYLSSKSSNNAKKQVPLYKIDNSNNYSNNSIDESSMSNYPSSDDSDDELENTELESEFLETKKYKFPSIGSDSTPAHQMSDFKFKDFCPMIFRQLREWFRISTEEYLITICGDFKLLEFISNSKSGQFFFFSYNSQFIIKTMTRTESIFLRKILPSYYRYVSQQPDTLLPKFYGMHRVKRKKQKIYFLIQQNVFYSDVDDIHDQYDIKGSTQGRRATKAEKKKGAILKDLDWSDQNKKIQIGSIRAKLFKDQLKRDTHWLRGEKIMDYSLLVGIHYRNRKKKKKKNKNANIILDHSTFEPELQTVNEDKEEDDDDDDDDDDEEEEEYKIMITQIKEKEELKYNLIKPSTTDHTGSEDEETDEHEYIDDYIPNRRNSAPKLIQSPNNNNNNNNNKHLKSQSTTVLNDIKLPILRSTNSGKQSKSKSKSKSKPLKINKNKSKSIKATKSTTLLFQNQPMYRGHISVKHPKRYKRKTAAQMQFAVDDIQIPKGIIEEEQQLYEQHKQQIEIKKEKEEKEKQKEKEKEKEQIKEEEEEEEKSNNNNNNDNDDICPWTTYHGGMVYENITNNSIGNEVYFIGLIDILQKYNKRKKLENWIKKMKYDKHAISAAPPDLYAQRMCDFFEDKVI